MNTKRLFIKILSVGSIFSGGLLWVLVHNDISKMPIETLPFGVAYAIYPLAIIMYVAGIILFVKTCIKWSIDDFIILTGINVISIMLFFISWILLIRLHIFPLG